jgi:hypothetical protein
MVPRPKPLGDIYSGCDHRIATREFQHIPDTPAWNTLEPSLSALHDDFT